MSIIRSMQFKRGEKEVLNTKLIGTLKPLKGEPVFELDTGKLKIGDGIKDYKDLPYVGNGAGPEPEEIDILLRGYFVEADGKFYEDAAHTKLLIKSKNRIYLDIPTGRLFSYVVAEDETILDGHYMTCVTYATSDKAGIVKLYDDLGENEDGTMTQKAITNSIDTIAFDVEPDEEDNCLILKKPKKRSLKNSKNNK